MASAGTCPVNRGDGYIPPWYINVPSEACVSWSSLVTVLAGLQIFMFLSLTILLVIYHKLTKNAGHRQIVGEKPRRPNSNQKLLINVATCTESFLDSTRCEDPSDAINMDEFLTKTCLYRILLKVQQEQMTRVSHQIAAKLHEISSTQAEAAKVQEMQGLPVTTVIPINDCVSVSQTDAVVGEDLAVECDPFLEMDLCDCLTRARCIENQLNNIISRCKEMPKCAGRDVQNSPREEITLCRTPKTRSPRTVVWRGRPELNPYNQSCSAQEAV